MRCPMFCRGCLYNLSRTSEPRCPECGTSFQPRNLVGTTLPTNGKLRWAMHHLSAWLAHRAAPSKRSTAMYCRDCFADLRTVVSGRCPICNKSFNARDSYTFRRSNDMMARVTEQFEHASIWGGLIAPIIPLWIGAAAIL